MQVVVSLSSDYKKGSREQADEGNQAHWSQGVRWNREDESRRRYYLLERENLDFLETVGHHLEWVRRVGTAWCVNVQCPVSQWFKRPVDGEVGDCGDER